MEIYAFQTSHGGCQGVYRTMEGRQPRESIV